MVALKIGVPVGDPWVIGEPGTRQQKDGRKKWQKKRWQKLLAKKMAENITFLLQQQID